jgi:ribosome biogenesis GTPase A
MKHYNMILSYLVNRKKSVLIIGSGNAGKSTVIDTVFE